MTTARALPVPVQQIAAQRLAGLRPASPDAAAQELRLLRRRSPEPARVTLDRLAATAPSPQTLAVLAAIDVSSLNPHDQVTWLTQWERCRGWFDAHAQTGIVAVGGAAPPAAHRLQPDSARDDIGREQVALALRLASSTGGARLDVARELTGRLARTLAALRAGSLTYSHARAIADAVAPLEDAAALAVERITLDCAPAFETLTSFRRRVERAVIAADPQTADEAHEAEVGTRKIRIWPEPHGMATVAATLTAAEAVTTMAALTALAHGSRADGDDRPIDVLRADAFARLFDAALADPHLPTQQRSRPHVGMTVDSATLMGLADHPAHLDGYGPIPPVMARLLAAGGDWHRMVTDPVSGALLDYGTRTYRPPTDLAEYLTARDRTCRWPTCARQARLCDLDHSVPFDTTGHGQGGSTSAAGMGCLCRRNHRQKTAGDIHLESHPDGSATWTTTTGHTYHRPAIDHCPEHTAHLRELRAQREAAAAQADAETEAAAADRDGEAADARWDNPDWIRAHTVEADTKAWTDHVSDDDLPPSDEEATENAQAARESSTIAHDTQATDLPPARAHTDNKSGNDPPQA